MNIRRQLLTGFLLLTLASVTFGVDDKPVGPDPDVRLLQDHNGNLVLALHRPWKSFSRPSVEVCLLPADLPETVNIHPLYFVNNHLKGEVTTNLYQSLDQADSVPVRRPLSEKDIEFEIIGNRNSLGRAAVCVACRTEAPGKTPSKEKNPLTRAAFCLLDYWSVEREGLYLDLPADYFAAPGKLRIWLLRDSQIVWSETIRWPGLANRQAPATASEAKPEATKKK